jgi:hypothetical protein
MMNMKVMIVMKNRVKTPKTLVICPNDHCKDNLDKMCIATKIIISEESFVTCFRPKSL